MFIVVKYGNNLLSIVGWMDKDDFHIYTHNRILFSHQKEGNPAICNNMDLEGILLSEISRERQISILYGVTHM